MKKWLPVISKDGIMFFFDKSTGSCQWTYPKEYDSKTKKYENSVDIFSLGIILYQLSHNLKHPFHNTE